MYQVKEWK